MSPLTLANSKQIVNKYQAGIKPFIKYIKIMKIESKQSYAIVSTTIRDINNREMRQMYELKNNIKNVLDSHKPESKEKKYISDDNLKLMYAVLSVFTKEYSSTQTSAFDDFLKEQDKPAEQPQQQEENKKSVSDPYHEDQTFG